MSVLYAFNVHHVPCRMDETPELGFSPKKKVRSGAVRKDPVKLYASSVAEAYQMAAQALVSLRTVAAHGLTRHEIGSCGANFEAGDELHGGGFSGVVPVALWNPQLEQVEQKLRQAFAAAGEFFPAVELTNFEVILAGEGTEVKRMVKLQAGRQ